MSWTCGSPSGMGTHGGTQCMEVDNQFMQWWTEELKQKPFPMNWVIPILKNLQGHPEAPRLWEKHLNHILRHILQFQSTTHGPCMAV